MGASKNRRSPEPLAVVEGVLQQNLLPAARVCAALSGGLDSVVLLHLLRELDKRHGFGLSAIHVNHQLSPNAQRWEAFCSDLCTEWRIPLALRRVSVESGRGTGVEAAARAARYRAFAGVDADWIALGHHRDDQAETVLLNLLRGSGMRGIAAMPEARRVAAGGPWLLRPLLSLPRVALQAYAREHCLSWVEDESNRDAFLRRNFVRHEVLVPLEERFPGCREALARAAGWAGEASLLLDELAAADACACLDAQQRLDLRLLGNLTPARARNLLRHWMRLADCRMASAARLAAIRSQIVSARPGQRIRIDIGGQVIRCFRGKAWIEPKDGVASPDEMPWQGETCLGWGSGRVIFRGSPGEGLSRSALGGAPLSLRVRRGGERMRLDARRPHRTLKNLCQEAGIPPWQRPVMPLLWCGEELVWVPGVGIAWEYRCAPGEPGVSPLWES